MIVFMQNTVQSSNIYILKLQPPLLEAMDRWNSVNFCFQAALIKFVLQNMPKGNRFSVLLGCPCSRQLKLN